MKEYLELFDEQNEPLHRQLLRREVHVQGYWHRTSQVYVLSQQQELLCNLRSSRKDLFPRLWDVSIGGHLEPGESYEACALRELGEELGIIPVPGNLHFLTIAKINGQDKLAGLLDREHAGIFLYQTELALPDFRFQEAEIDDLLYLPLATVKANLLAETPEIPFIPLAGHYLANISLIESRLGL